MEKEVLIALIAGLAGSVFTYFFGIKTLIRQKKLDLKTEYLISAWIGLEDASNRSNPNENHENIEKSIAMIQLFGSKDQILLSRDFAKKMEQNNGADLKPLLDNLRNDLRNDLRKELNLKDVSNLPYTSYRIIK